MCQQLNLPVGKLVFLSLVVTSYEVGKSNKVFRAHAFIKEAVDSIPSEAHGNNYTIPVKEMRDLNGIYSGSVEDAGDPLRMGRLRCRVPAVYGTVTGGEADGSSITTEDLPWALPMGLPAGATNDSGMIGWLPAVGDHVFVQFLDSEPDKPVWCWGGQDTSQVAGIGGWTRSPGGYTSETSGKDLSNQQGSPPKPPVSAFLSRYGHLIDLQPDSLTFRTANGYLLRFTDSTQQLDVYSPNMVALVGQMKFTGTDFQFYPSNSFNVSTADTNISANTNTITAAINNTLSADVVNQLDSPIVQLGPVGTAFDPVVRLSDVVSLALKIMAFYDTHTHLGNLGYPTSPPIIPMILTPTASNTTFTA